MTKVRRRSFLSAFVGGAAATCCGTSRGEFNAAIDARRSKEEPFGYCLNTGTIRGHKLAMPEIVKIAAQAGYHAIEPWTDEIHRHREQGGSLPELRRMIEDAGLTVESAIGFSPWIVDDPGERAKGLESARRDMAALKEIGGKRIAAPPAGITEQLEFRLSDAAERYHAFLELGTVEGIVPQVELWGFSRHLKRIGEVLYVAAEASHPDACVLTDVYHIYKGGSDFAGLKLVSGRAMHLMHINDYPSSPTRESITDAARVFPGDGVAPLTSILQDLFLGGFRGFLSLELFNESYYRRPALEVAQEGLQKTRNAVTHAMRSA